MSKIILTTLNARYTHSAIGLRYLRANLHELQPISKILEFSINDNIYDIAETLIDEKPLIIGIGAYIWNASQVSELIEIIKKISPQTMIILGGPEASYEPFRVDFSSTDFIIQGEGEEAFYELCKKILNDEKIDQQLIKPQTLNLSNVVLPYELYDDHDVQNRYIYVEASRGCPFKCEFCLSSIDDRVRYFDLEKLLEQFEMLWLKGVRNFKFIDRTFNLNMRYAHAILDFFLTKEPPYFLHFEVIPDHFPSALKEKIKKFTPHTLQLEVGIQTLNVDVAQKIDRILNIEKIKENISFLENETSAHMHVDLIIGLPSESLESFGKNLNMLYEISKSEIQLGILKKLSGTTLHRHDQTHNMIYSEKPPYEILCNDKIDFKQMQIMKRFARFWDLTYNSGNFQESIKLLFKNGEVYENFYAFSVWIYDQTLSTWKISLDRLAEFLFSYLIDEMKYAKELVGDTMLEDFMRVGGRKIPKFLREFTELRSTPLKDEASSKFAKRQNIRC